MPVERMWRTHDLKKSYDVVIVGAGVHGLAIAYYLGKRGVTSVEVLDKGYLGGGASGRNTAIIRSNYRTPEGVTFYDESVKLYERMSVELGYNVFFSQQGHLSISHTESGISGLRVRAEVNKLMGVDSRLISAAEIKELVPSIDTTSRQRYPILAALYHPPGGIIRHDAVVWAYAREADKMGISIFPFTEAVSIGRSNGSVSSVQTSRGEIKTGTVVNATAGFCSTVAKLAGIQLPVIT